MQQRQDHFAGMIGSDQNAPGCFLQDIFPGQGGGFGGIVGVPDAASGRFKIFRSIYWFLIADSRLFCAAPSSALLLSMASYSSTATVKDLAFDPEPPDNGYGSPPKILSLQGMVTVLPSSSSMVLSNSFGCIGKLWHCFGSFGPHC